MLYDSIIAMKCRQCYFQPFTDPPSINKVDKQQFPDISIKSPAFEPGTFLSVFFEDC